MNRLRNILRGCILLELSHRITASKALNIAVKFGTMVTIRLEYKGLKIILTFHSNQTGHCG